MLLTRLLVALALFLTLGCVSPKVPCWSDTHPDEGYIEFISGAVEVVRDKFPEWYNEKTPIALDLEDKENLAYANRTEQGVIGIKLTQKALDLCTEEDLASILLHEYVHVKLWDEIAAMVSDTEDCNHIRHELKANLTVAFAYDELGYSTRMLRMALDLYEHYYVGALLECDEAVYNDMPKPRWRSLRNR